MKLFKPFRALTVVLFVLLLTSGTILQKSKTDYSTDASNYRVSAIYARLAVNSGQQDVPPLLIIQSDVMNAWTDGTSVVITTAMLSLFENDDQLAMVLAHEIAHAINHDPQRTDGQLTSNDVEAHADKLGAFIMMRAGFNECRGKDIFLVFKKHFGDTANTTTHPDFAYRYDQLNLPQCQ